MSTLEARDRSDIADFFRENLPEPVLISLMLPECTEERSVLIVSVVDPCHLVAASSFFSLILIAMSS